MGSALAEMVRVGVLSLVFTKVTKAIGQSEISEIIQGTAWIFVGINALVVLKPVCEGIKGFVETWSSLFSNIGKLAKPIVDLMS